MASRQVPRGPKGDKGRFAIVSEFKICSRFEKMKGPMEIALYEAKKAAAVGEVPIGAVIRDDLTLSLIHI